jgi:FAD/FMN-containing dehydrogenase
MRKLDRILTKPPRSRAENLIKEYVDVEVEGGMSVVDFVEELDSRYGLGLPMIGNYAGQTVAGVASTSTHGSGYFAGTLVR